ncbi:MAG: hypothetical protein JSR77_12985 [Planctomycetes bacterium]|nr:hypothetical protein [Planctomycetota bacterium]
MSQFTAIPTLTDDDKMLAAATAARSERRNRPVTLIGASVVVLLAAALWLLMEWNAAAAARRTYAFQQTKARRAAEATAQLLDMRKRETSDETSSKLNEPTARIYPDVEAAARATGIKTNVLPKGSPRTALSTPVSKQKLLEYEVRDESLAVLLAWTQKCATDIPGLEVYAVKITPEPQQWRLNVTFSRWEKNLEKTEGA